MNRKTLRSATSVVVAAIIAGGLASVGTTPAMADPAATTGTTKATVMADTQQMSGPSLTSPQVGTSPAGTELDLICYTHGQRVQGYFSPSNPSGWDDLWYRDSKGLWYPDVDLETGSNDPVTPACPARMFNPANAVLYALDHYREKSFLQSDCTYFVSSAWWYAGLPRSDQWTDGATQKVLGQDAPKYNIYGATPTAAVADRFKNYVINQGYATITQISWPDPTAGGAQPGDVIAYDWNNGADGVIDHLAIVTNVAHDGRPVVAQHSPSRRRPWNVDEKGTALLQVSQYKGARAYLLREIA